MAYNSTIDKAVDDILIYGNTVKDGSGTSYVPLLDTDGHLQLDVLTSGLPTGASTSANQTTIIGHLDGVEGLLTTIDADTGSILLAVDGIETLIGTTNTTLTTIDGRVDGIEGLLTTIDGDTGSIMTAVELLDDAVYVDDADWTDSTSKHLLVGGLYQSVPQTVTDGDVAPFNITANGAIHAAIQNTVTVSGTVTANLSATDNTVLDNIDADLTTIIGHVDGIEGLLTTIDADTGSILTAVDGLETSNSAIQTAVELIDDTIYTAGTSTYTETTSKGQLLLAVRRDADTTLANTTNEMTPLQVDANGYLKVEIFDGGGSHTVDNNGTFAVQVDGSALTALQLIDDTVFADDGNGFTVGTSKVNAIGLLADSTSTDSVDEGDIGIPRMSLDRKQIVTNAPTAEAHGLSVFNASSSDGATALTSTAQVIKASAGQVYGWYIYNPNSTAQYVQFYNTAAASVTVGTTSPLFMLTIPATSGANVEFTNGITFTNAGFSCAATSTAGGNGAPTTALDAVIFYK